MCKCPQGALEVTQSAEASVSRPASQALLALDRGGAADPAAVSTSAGTAAWLSTKQGSAFKRHLPIQS